MFETFIHPSNIVIGPICSSVAKLCPALCNCNMPGFPDQYQAPNLNTWFVLQVIEKKTCAKYLIKTFQGLHEKSSETDSESQLSHVPLFATPSPWNSPGQNTGVGSLSLLQGIFPTQGLNLGLPHCRWILYQLSSQGSPHEQSRFSQMKLKIWWNILNFW